MPPPIITAWQKLPLTSPPFLFPGDEFLLHPKHRQKISLLKNFSEYCRSEQLEGKSSKLHLGLLPLPYWGDLQRAKIFLLMLNPGLGHLNYYSEYKIPACRKMLLNNLRQMNLDKRYPNVFLNPRHCWDGGYRYWTEKLAPILRALMTKRQCTYQEALSLLSRRLACVQLVPYHSASFQAGSMVSKLASSSLAMDFVHDELLLKARKEKIQIIVLRGNNFWKLREESQVIVYRNHESRGASLSLNSRGGKAILRNIQN